MAFGFDHAFVFVGAGAPDADFGLVAAGLVEGTPNIHPGQGTQNRRFFFQNGMIEFLWVHSRGRGQERSHCPGSPDGAIPVQTYWCVPIRNRSFEDQRGNEKFAVRHMAIPPSVPA